MTVRDELLDAAARTYAEAGYRGATTRRIALAAGVNEITLFRHFGSKDALLREALVRSQNPNSGELLPEKPVDPPAELLVWAGSHITDMRSRQALIRTCMGEFAEHPGLFVPENSGPVRAARALTQYLTRLRQRGLARAEFDASAAAALLIGTLFADAMGRDIMPELYPNRPDKALGEYIALFLRGIGADPKPQETAG
jgi:AcrR family transcriptional regulator